MKTALITGGSGMVGTALSALLQENGFAVRHLSTRGGRRKLPNGIEVFPWNPEAGTMDVDALENVKYVFHLAGASISGRWTKAYKQEIRDSRVKSAGLLYKTIEQMAQRPEKIISASAVGIYPSSLDHVYNETEQAASNFLGEVCAEWEAGVARFTKLGMKEARVRIGIVLSKHGGFLPVVARPVKLFAGTPLGSGKQRIPWIHLDDLTRIFFHVADSELQGPINAGGVEAATQWQFTKALGKVLRRPVWPIPAPAFLLRLILGESAQLALMSTRVSEKKLLDSGFAFQYTDLEEALRKELSH
jgi:uncharacterized protein (TIGR01777 family)